MKHRNKKILNQELKDVADKIHLFCHDCMNHQLRIDCLNSHCPLFGYRPWAKSERFKTNEKKLNLREID